jgi:hypothetical protein
MPDTSNHRLNEPLRGGAFTGCVRPIALAVVTTDTVAIEGLTPSRVTELDTMHVDCAGAPVQLRSTV